MKIKRKNGVEIEISLEELREIRKNPHLHQLFLGPGIEKERAGVILERFRGKEVTRRDLMDFGCRNPGNLLWSLYKVGMIKKVSRGVYYIPKNFSSKHVTKCTKQLRRNVYERIKERSKKIGELKKAIQTYEVWENEDGYNVVGLSDGNPTIINRFSFNDVEKEELHYSATKLYLLKILKKVLKYQE